MKKKAESSTLYIYADGGSRGNPGPSGIGVVLYNEKNKIVAEISKFIGHATNNVAEYLAVVYGLQEAQYKKCKIVILNVDSQLVAKQLKGEYRVKDQNIKKFYDIAINLFRGFDKVDIHDIPREKNSEADALVNKALDLQTLL